MAKPNKGDYVTTNTKPKRMGTLRNIKVRENDTVAVILQDDQSCYLCDVEMIEGYGE